MASDRDDSDGREDRRQDDDYEVGRNRPPRHTQFRKGASGNKKGRPKGRRNLKTDLVEELASGIAIQEDGKRRIVPKQRAMIKRAVAQAIQGDTKAMSNLVSMMMKLMGEDVKSELSSTLSAPQKLILDSYRERLKAEILEEIDQERRDRGYTTEE
jgi:hypothetical protein